MSRPNDLFITGTDTGVGKTYVTALLLAELRRRGVRAAACKPIACGPDGRHDAAIYAKLMNGEQSLDALNPVELRHPLAPSVAAKLERRRIGLARIHTGYRHLAARYEIVLVEGAGGLLVPIKRDYFVADLARDLGLPVVVVARLGLGTINHSLLTVRQAQAHGVAVRGLILNVTGGGRPGLAARTNIETVPQLCGVPLFGVVPHESRRTTVARKICDALWPGTR